MSEPFGKNFGAKEAALAFGLGGMGLGAIAATLGERSQDKTDRAELVEQAEHTIHDTFLIASRKYSNFTYSNDNGNGVSTVSVYKGDDQLIQFTVTPQPVRSLESSVFDPSATMIDYEITLTSVDPKIEMTNLKTDVTATHTADDLPEAIDELLSLVDVALIVDQKQKEEKYQRWGEGRWP